MSRIILAFRAFFKVLFDGSAAAKVQQALDRPSGPNLEILQSFQRDGRLIDFLLEDIGAYQDDQVGAAVRAIHKGCRKALLESVEVVPIRNEGEGAMVEVPAGYDPSQIRLVGNVTGRGPYRGTVKHHGWQIGEVKTTALTTVKNDKVITPAEIEVS